MNDFLIVKNMKQFIMSLDNIIINYPRKENVIKDRLLNDSLDILYLIYEANYSKNRRNIQIKILSKISMLDFYLERSLKNKYISEKECLKKSNQLLTITKMIHGWIKSDKSKL